MRLLKGLSAFLLSLSAACTLAAAPIDISGTATFRGGIYGAWDYEFTSGPTDLYLQRITIDLSPTNLKFDTAPGGFGSLGFQDIGGFEGTDASTGLSGIAPGTGAALDGGSLLTFTFSNFTAGKTFHHTGDVDHPDPTLEFDPCASKTGWRQALCYATNPGPLARNTAALAAASVVTPAQFEGALVTFTFGGEGYYTTEFETNFSPAGGLQFLRSVDPFAAQVEQTPEPATFAMLGTGLLLIGVIARRRRA
jgi:hypothetical protein